MKQYLDVNMGFSRIESLAPEVLFAFVSLFPEEDIRRIEFQIFNGTVTRSHYFDEETYVNRSNFTVCGKRLANIRKALDNLEFNQINHVSLSIGEGYISCTLDALERKLFIGSIDLLDIAVVKGFCKEHDIRKATVNIRMD